MKAKIFEVILRKLSSGKSPATALEERLNKFLSQHPALRLVATHMSTHAEFGGFFDHHFLHTVLCGVKHEI